MGWGHGWSRKDFLEEDIGNTKRAFFRLMLHDPLTFLFAKWHCFAATMNIDIQKNMIYILQLHHSFDVDYLANEMQGVHLFVPWNPQMRLKMLDFLLTNNRDWRIVSEIIYRILYNHLFSIIGLLMALFIVIKKKNYNCLVILMGYVVLLVALFLTVPEAGPAYYFPIIFFGEALLFIVLMAPELLMQGKREK